MSVIEQLPLQSAVAPMFGGTGQVLPLHLQRPVSRRLRAKLVGLDVIAVALGWSVVVAAALSGGVALSAAAVLAAAVVAPAMAIAFIAGQHLYLARVCNVRSVELQRLGRAAVATAAAVYVGAMVTGVVLPLGVIGAASALSFVLLALGRSGYRSWLGNHRRAGRYARRVVLVGANDDAGELQRIVSEHPELGYRIVGVVAPRAHAGVIQGVPWLGDLCDVVRVAEVTAATGALVVATALSTREVNDVSRQLLDAGKHVQLSSGLRGISTKRLKTMSLAHEPLLYVEQAALSGWQLHVKRVIDVALSSVLLVLAAPVLAAAAVAIKLEDGGPLLFSQKRVGRDGVPFEVFKLRTMIPDAEACKPALEEHNERDGGPLFKLACDPRVTRVGRLLRASSVDELPQLVNVLRGDMSLVGPRPALPDEAEQFDDALRARTQVLPGVTGLWQVEARDNPAFGPYRRLDLFYVENWSVTLDFGILLATVGVVGGRALRVLLPRRRPELSGGHGQRVVVLD